MTKPKAAQKKKSNLEKVFYLSLFLLITEITLISLYIGYNKITYKYKYIPVTIYGRSEYWGQDLTNRWLQIDLNRESGNK